MHAVIAVKIGMQQLIAFQKVDLFTRKVTRKVVDGLR